MKGRASTEPLPQIPDFTGDSPEGQKNKIKNKNELRKKFIFIPLIKKENVSQKVIPCLKFQSKQNWGQNQLEDS